MTSHELPRQGHRLIQLGIALFLFACIEGFAIPSLAAPPLGLSVHRLSAFSGVFFVALGLLWPRLALSTNQARVAYWFAIFSDLATIAAYVLGPVAVA